MVVSVIWLYCQTKRTISVAIFMNGCSVSVEICITYFTMKQIGRCIVYITNGCSVSVEICITYFMMKQIGRCIVYITNGCSVSVEICITIFMMEQIGRCIMYIMNGCHKSMSWHEEVFKKPTFIVQVCRYTHESSFSPWW
jgi:hypothetical protein